MKNLKHKIIRCAAESGRTMAEVMAVLAIMGVLSVGGLWFFQSSRQEKEITDLIYEMNLQVTQIYPALEQAGTFTSKDDLNTFLAPYKKQVGNYVLTFQADPSSTDNDFVTQITTSSGEPIKGKKCRALISKMSKLKMAQDVSFTLRDEEMEDGTTADVTVPLNGRTVDYSAMCGD